MSIEIMSLVWKRSPERGASLLVLLALADWADDDGWSYPSINTLSFKSRTSRRGAQKIVDGLVERGMVEKVRGNSRKSSRYRIRIENLNEIRQKPSVEKPQTIDDLGGEQGSPGGRTLFTTGGEQGSPGGANAVRPSGEHGSPLGVNTVRPWGERGSPNPSFDTSRDTSVKPGGGIPPTDVERKMHEIEERQIAEGRGRFVKTAAAVVLPESENGMKAWAQLVKWWNGEFERLDPPRQLPKNTLDVWEAIGGAKRFSDWVRRPADIGFAMREFLKAWEVLVEKKTRDKVLMQ